ncbi:hypothetical protein PLESTB_000817200 [Pleodorina starrii]|uniref:DUF2061 domain-containing protein n=1 Tax=Pleodorina starrii TaxID=330485 RepID=A0A9W6BLN4_9CHLO|nr:hypothetical protein PLESTM_000133000 [Pleodorina starrii]GLC54040.1 hypothetical protein PLESTB_000817200 [Pleodorina starrii]GLC64652.1 hypothetical protein PLESTF_000188900 [Pleodorina starrii]
MVSSLLRRSSCQVGCQARLQQQQRRPLRLLCALSLERPSEAAGRKNKPSAALPSAALSVVESDLVVSPEVQDAYEAGYQAGLAAARQAQSSEAEKPRPQHDSLWRSIVKALSWRFFSTATTIVLTMTFFSATLDEALELGAAEFLSKYILYLIHERLWILVTLF